MGLSKSQFIRGKQCQKSLWLYKHRPNLRTLPDPQLQARFDEGSRVGVLAQELFPGGTGLSYSAQGFGANIRKTKDLVAAGVSTIYEATLHYDGVLVMVDILHRGEKGWEIHEVKASTSVKEPVHINDLAIQYHVVAGSGLKINRCSLVHINNQYERVGDLDVRSLFTVSDQTEPVRDILPQIRADLERFKQVVAHPYEPDIGIGKQCTDPYECDYKSYCWEGIPEVSVFSLTRLATERKFHLYHDGVITFEQLPEDMHLTPAQNLQVSSELEGTAHIDPDGIRSFLDQLQEPIGYLDFETFMPAIPLFQHQRPYQQIPFQFSLHIQEGDNLEHFEFLAEPGTDPRPEFVNHLLEATRGCETIVVYNKSFETMILHQLAELFPEKSQLLDDIVSRIVDLMDVFKNRFYYTRDMNGSYSIKAVLPALVVDLSYQGLAIADGDAAMSAYLELQDEADEQVIERGRHSLLEYCRVDTLAMVRIVERLNEAVTAED